MYNCYYCNLAYQGCTQGRIYVANENPTSARNMSILNYKLKILGQIILN